MRSGKLPGCSVKTVAARATPHIRASPVFVSPAKKARARRFRRLRGHDAVRAEHRRPEFADAHERFPRFVGMVGEPLFHPRQPERGAFRAFLSVQHGQHVIGIIPRGLPRGLYLFHHRGRRFFQRSFGRERRKATDRLDGYGRHHPALRNGIIKKPALPALNAGSASFPAFSGGAARETRAALFFDDLRAALRRGEFIFSYLPKFAKERDRRNRRCSPRLCGARRRRT